MMTIAIVVVVPFMRQGLQIESGATLADVPLDEAAHLIGHGFAIPAGAQLEREPRPIRGHFVTRPSR